MARHWGTSRSGRRAADIWADWQAAQDPDRANTYAAEFVSALPADYAAWFEAGLLSKALGRWQESAARNQRAVELFTAHDAPQFDGVNPAAWNLGIAATALGDWKSARRALTAYGINGFDLPSDEPIDQNLGTVPIRLNPNRPSLAHQVMFCAGHTEVVWCWRRSPAHAVIASVPLPESGHRFRDVVLHDGEPKGTRRNGEQEVSVFDQLDRLQESGMPTWQAIVSGQREGDLDRLANDCGQRGLGIDDWTSIPILCSECSHGSPDIAHEHGQLAPQQAKLGLAGHEAELDAALHEWLSVHDHVVLADFNLLW